jgi:hypothetical protein
MLVVTFRRGEDVAGEVVLKSGRLSVTDESLERVLRRPIFVNINNSLEDIFPQDDPLLFIKSLWLHYKSPYFNASKAVEVDDR